MSALVSPARADALDLRSYQVEKGVHALAAAAFGWKPRFCGRVDDE